ncbi:MAG: glycosyltransferase family 2 protein [Armatimonadetes bacterium]|nr:glycosyltransferase family 2 protein [Armatimonadota bacterium]
MPAPTLSLVFPIFDEQEVLPHLLTRLDTVVADLQASTGPVEAIFVNDGSRDASWQLLNELSQTRPWMRLVNLSRNFGHQIAVTAGMHYAGGDAVVIMDADLQDPPELLPEMIRLWKGGNDVVYAVRTEREGETAFKKATASAFYKLLQSLTNVPIPADTGDFRLMDRKVVAAMNAMGEHHRFLRGMAAWVGFTQIGLPYKRDARAAGETKYPLKKMVRLAVDAIASFSQAPLKLATYMGFAVTLLSLLAIVVVIILRLTPGIRALEGQATTLIAALFIGGVQLVCIGILGEYIGRIYDEVKRRPLYLVSRTHGFDDNTAVK